MRYTIKQEPRLSRAAAQVRQGLLRCAMMLSAIAWLSMGGCEMRSFFDQSRTGSFQHHPTTIPILDRIDVIEEEEHSWSRATPVMPDDLVPSELTYILHPGDLVIVRVYELLNPGQWEVIGRRIDAGGYYRVPELGDVRAAGLTPQQFQDEITRIIRETIKQEAQVDVVVEDALGLRYTVSGLVANPGMFTLQNPDLRLWDALAIARGVPTTTQRVYVIRAVPLSDEMRPTYERPGPGQVPPPRNGRQPTVEELIEELDRPDAERPPQPDGTGAMPPQRQETPDTGGFVDIDELEPAQRPRAQQEPAPIDVDDVTPQPRRPSTIERGDTFIYVEERGEWVRVPRSAVTPGQPPADAPPANGKPAAPPVPAQPMMLERIIEVDYQRLSHGDMSQNLVIRPGDSIYVEGPPLGYIYIEGEIARPGVYNLPQIGDITLSRFISTAGGLGPIAMPQRVDITRRIGPNREATVRLNLEAIRMRTEPDIVLKPDDHIIIGTSWIATPLAVIRNGFRATYGFGFLLDRNFGTDVFGPEPGRFQ